MSEASDAEVGAGSGAEAGGSDAAIDLGLVDEVERAGVHGWPPTQLHDLGDDWILRATPGLERGRSNNALTPRTRPLAGGELASALERVRAWSALHGIRGGLQVSPLELHAAIVPGLLARGWEPDFTVWVMTADRSAVLAGESGLGRSSGPAVAGPPWICSRSPDPDWLAAWARCRGGRSNIEAHVATVFQNMAARGQFGRLGDVATGIAVEDPAGDWAGLFSLVVSERERGRGLGRRLTRELVRSVAVPRVYLQVDQRNAVALALYRSLGFRISHSYQHLNAPRGWATG